MLLAYSIAMAWGISDELLPVILPVAAYWTTSGIYQVMLTGSGAKYRLFTREEESARNLVSRSQVLVRVLLHQTMQMTLAFSVFMVRPPPPSSPSSWLSARSSHIRLLTHGHV